jgi:hypothetical protein
MTTLSMCYQEKAYQLTMALTLHNIQTITSADFAVNISRSATRLKSVSLTLMVLIPDTQQTM